MLSVIGILLDITAFVLFDVLIVIMLELSCSLLELRFVEYSYIVVSIPTAVEVIAFEIIILLVIKASAIVVVIFFGGVNGALDSAVLVLNSSVPIVVVHPSAVFVVTVPDWALFELVVSSFIVAEE